MISIDYKNKIITNSKNEVIEYTKENVEKVLLQTNEIFLLDDFSWNKNLENCLQILRIKRDLKLRETDYIFLSDTTKIISTEEKAKLKTERQRLRDITENITENTSIDEVVKRIRSI